MSVSLELWEDKGTPIKTAIAYLLLRFTVNALDLINKELNLSCQ